MSESKLPTGRLGRFARLAALGARAGKQRVTQALGGTDNDQLANTAAEALGQLRGLAAKVGQMASYVDGVVPEGQREHYERAMASLRNATPTMTAEEAARLVEAELGAPPNECFAHFEAEPFASASIGQVHRATTHEGTEVAVKVQFTHIQKAVEADLNNTSLFGALLGPLGGKLGVKEQLAEMRARFTEELDYGHEAARQQQFAALFADDPQVLVPEVIESLSARRVMTSHFVSGLDFGQACAAPLAHRQAWATTLWRFVFWSLLGGGLFNADPHPGNYIFGDDGQVWFLDFGCTRKLAPHDVAQVLRCHRGAVSGDLEELYAGTESMFEMPNLEAPLRELTRSYVKDCFEPIWTQGEFRITRPFAAQLLTDMRDNARVVLRHHSKSFKPLPPQWLFFNRLQLGFYSVLARLDAPVNYNAIERSILARVRD